MSRVSIRTLPVTMGGTPGKLEFSLENTETNWDDHFYTIKYPEGSSPRTVHIPVHQIYRIEYFDDV